MDQSRHIYTDKRGYRCAIEIISDDGIVVFDSLPKLSFYFSAYGVKIKRWKQYDCVVTYVIKDKRIFLRSFDAILSLFSQKQMLGATVQRLGDGKWSRFEFDDILVDYSGTLNIGKNFDYRFWKHEDKATEVPFSPEVYKENGSIVFEKGSIVSVKCSARPKSS